jgi:16S rRNA (guanine966-N2)-methyltransferase
MQQGEVRIIGGKWRSRKLKFPAINSLRPTPDRIRETLFNWLAPTIEGSRCLDLFAGSGALGFEALSRGAEYVYFIDKEPRLVQYLKNQIEIFQASNNAQVQCMKFPFTALPPLSIQNFDVVFLDPPYNRNHIAPCLQWLEQQPWLAKQALVYVEAESALHPLPLSQNWQILHSKTSGQVGYHLIEFTA